MFADLFVWLGVTEIDLYGAESGPDSPYTTSNQEPPLFGSDDYFGIWPIKAGHVADGTNNYVLLV